MRQLHFLAHVPSRGQQCHKAHHSHSRHVSMLPTCHVDLAWDQNKICGPAPVDNMKRSQVLALAYFMLFGTLLCNFALHQHINKNEAEQPLFSPTQSARLVAQFLLQQEQQLEPEQDPEPLSEPVEQHDGDDECEVVMVQHVATWRHRVQSPVVLSSKSLLPVTAVAKVLLLPSPQHVDKADKGQADIGSCLVVLHRGKGSCTITPTAASTNAALLVAPATNDDVAQLRLSTPPLQLSELRVCNSASGAFKVLPRFETEQELSPVQSSTDDWTFLQGQIRGRLEFAPHSQLVVEGRVHLMGGADTSLTVFEGSTVLLGPGASLEVGSGSKLEFLGDFHEPVLLSPLKQRDEHESGAWDEVSLLPGSTGVFMHCFVTGGGAGGNKSKLWGHSQSQPVIRALGPSTTVAMIGGAGECNVFGLRVVGREEYDGACFRVSGRLWVCCADDSLCCVWWCGGP